MAAKSPQTITSAARPGSSRALAIVVGPALLLVAVLIAYLPALEAGFVWDDDVYVTDNPLLTAPDGLKRIWF